MPSGKAVLQRFLFFQYKEKNTIQASANLVTNELKKIYDSRKIPCIAERSIVVKIKKIHEAWTILKRNIDSKSLTEKSKRDKFIDEICSCFKINKKVKNDSALKLTEANNKKRKKSVVKSDNSCIVINKRRNKSSTSFLSENMVIGDEEETASENESSDEEYVFSKKLKTEKNESPMIKVDSVEICQALDRTCTSNGKAAHLLGAVLHSTNSGRKEIYSERTVGRNRNKVREKVAQEIKKSYEPKNCLTAHWDVKKSKTLLPK